jgi:hypothetical protein
MSCHVEMKDAPPVMSNDEETVENAEGERRHGKEIHRGDGFTVVPRQNSIRPKIESKHRYLNG